MPDYMSEDYIADATHDAYEQGYEDGKRDAIQHGRWEERYVDDPYDTYGFLRRRFFCSACGKWNCYGKTAYCMHCGAKMDGE